MIRDTFRRKCGPLWGIFAKQDNTWELWQRGFIIRLVKGNFVVGNLDKWYLVVELWLDIGKCVGFTLLHLYV